MRTKKFLSIQITKLFVPLLIPLSVCLIPGTNLKAQSNSPKANGSVSGFGYINKGDSIEFVFGQQQLITIGKVEIPLEKRMHEIRQVNIAGDFNGWDPGSVKYQMNKAEGTLFKITISKKSLGKTGELRQFKFVLNHQYWVEPPAQAMNTFTGRDGNTNLTLKL